MKKLIMAVVIVMSSMSVQAEQASCEQIASLAESVMKARQGGSSMASLIAVAGESGIAKLMVESAFEVSRYSTDKFKNRTISDFRDEWYLICYQSRNK